MQITYTYENLNILIMLLGIVIITHMIILRKIEKRTIKFANYETLKKVIGYEIIYKNYLPLVLRLLTMILIIIGISNLTLIMIKDVSEVDFVIAIDASSSMLTSDNGTFNPSRLEAAKESALHIIDMVPDDTEIGVVTFAGKSYVRMEPTSDHKKLKEAVHEISFDSPAGTAIGDALITSSGLLVNSSKKKVITLITDGRTNAGVEIEEALKYVNVNEVKVYAIGIGSKNATLNPTANSSGIIPEYMLENSTLAATIQELNETELLTIANQTSGMYFYATNNTELDSALEKAVFRSNTVTIPLFRYVLIIAALILVIEWGLGATKYKTIP